MKAGHLISPTFSWVRRLSWVSVIIAVVSLPRILAGLFPLHSSGVAGDPVSEAAERPGSVPTSRERAIAAPHADARSLAVGGDHPPIEIRARVQDPDRPGLGVR